MKYKFWGWENADCKAINGQYPGIHNPRDLYDFLCCVWQADTCAPRMREAWTKENKTWGQCSITAFLVQDIFGGQVYGILRRGGNYHCFNEVDGVRFDLTSEMFGEEVLDYDNCVLQEREVHFEKEEKRLRYELLKNGLQAFCETVFQYGTKANRFYLARNAEQLLWFGHRFASPKGSSYYLSDDGTPWKERPRETWITSRMAHVYCMGTFLGHEGSRELAEYALRGLMTELHDEEHGGWFAGVTQEGGILPGKNCYQHAFVILAASSGILAGIEGADELMQDALKVYDERFWNEEEGLSCDTWNTEFTELDSYRGINANMHSVEAFLAVADVQRREEYRERAGRIIQKIKGWAEQNNDRIPEHFTSKWQMELEKNKEKPDDPFKPYGATPGHGIEWARLIVQWAVSTYSGNGKEDTEALKSFVELAERLYNRAIEDAWNADGAPGIVYTTDWQGMPVVHDRMHWTLAEAINTSATLYVVTGDEKYAKDYESFLRYLDSSVLDHNTGSWFHQLDEKNELKKTVWPGKSDLYHALQAMLIPYEQVGVSIAVSLKENEK